MDIFSIILAPIGIFISLAMICAPIYFFVKYWKNDARKLFLLEQQNELLRDIISKMRY